MRGRLFVALGAFLAMMMWACDDSSGGNNLDDDTDTGFGPDTDVDTDVDTDTDSDTDTDTDPTEDDAIIEWNGCTTTVSFTGDEYRTYQFETDCPLLENEPSSGELQVVELDGQPVVRTHHLMFDALFALAMQEVRDASVDAIQDWSFNDNNPVACTCFETGAKWHYVWTRDTAYAAQLGLALVEPGRTANSLSFKLSERKTAAGGGDLQIVQDTGSGGSWPVSTDRVVWALGAFETLKFLHGPDRDTFFADAYEAIVNTIENDRQTVFDAGEGLYRGEQSFLDWREQTYPTWTADTTVHLGMSRALSTNAGHHAILTVGAALAQEAGDTTLAATYGGWADDLAAAINDEFWLEDHGLYSTLKTTELDLAPLEKFDLLGESLAVLGGIADQDRAETVAASYPHTVAGPPVIWPQNPQTPIYHNRGIWPFVTAYAVRAAAKSGNADVVSHDVWSLMVGAATNLSNMENFEFMTLFNHLEDGALTGPVINSRRQLWSVAGYLSMVLDTIFGVRADQDGLLPDPFIPATIREDLFGEADSIELRNLPYRGKQVDVVVHLASAGGSLEGFYHSSGIVLNGSAVSGGAITPADLQDENTLEIQLDVLEVSTGGLNLVEDEGDYTVFYAPKEPTLDPPTPSGDDMALAWNSNGEVGVVFNVYRNGELVADGLTGTSWTDTDWSATSTSTPCYTVETEYTGSGTTSHHADPQCYWGATYERIFQYEAVDLTGPATVFEHGRTHFPDWGYPGEQIVLETFTPVAGGDYYVQIDFGNGRPVDTGITGSSKRVEVVDTSDDSVDGTGVAMMPHLGAGDWDRWGHSSFVPVTLEAGVTYRVVVSDEFNMSYFDHFSIYTGGDGGGADLLNRVNVSGLKLLLMEEL